MRKTFTDTRKKFAAERRTLILKELEGLSIAEAERQELADRITHSMGEYDANHFNSQGQWTERGLTDC